MPCFGVVLLCDSFKIQRWRPNIVMDWGTFWKMLDYNTKYSPIMENQMLLFDMEEKRWLVTYKQNRVKMAWAFMNIRNGIHHLGFSIVICEKTTSCYIFHLTNQMLCTLVCMIGLKLDGYTHGWGTQGMFHPKPIFKTLLWMTITFTK
jgi:hypothetical protein